MSYSLQTHLSTNPMVFATTFASTILHLQLYKRIYAGVRTMFQELRLRLVIAAMNVQVIPAILVVETIHTDTCH